MSDYARRTIYDTTPQSLKGMNDNFEYLWLKVFGDITNADISDTADISGTKIEANSITADQIDVTTLSVGTGGIKIDGSATIDFSQVTGYTPPDMSQYVLNTALTSALSDKVTATDLTNALTNYMTSGAVSTTLMDYVTNSNLTTKLGQDYIITGKIAANHIVTGTLDCSQITISNLKASQIDLTGYVTNSLLTDSLSSYATTNSLNSGLSDKVTNSGLSSTLSSYATVTAMTNALTNYVTSGTYSTALSDLLNHSNLTTVLSTNYIITGSISANQIATGSLSTSRLVGSVINFDNGCSVDTSGGDIRLRYSTNNYLRYGNSSADFYYSGSVMASVQSGGIYSNGNLLATQSWVASQGYATGAGVTVTAVFG